MRFELRVTEIVKLLLMDPRVSPQADNNDAIRIASHNGHTEIVKILLMDPRVDPESNDNAAIKKAHENCFQLLFMDNRINKLFPQYFVFCSGLNILLPEINRFILEFMVLLRREELKNNLLIW